MVKFIRHVFDVFGYSPFPDLFEHANLCVKCVHLIGKVIDAYGSEYVIELVKKIDNIEKKADKIKERIGKYLSDPIILPVNKYAVLNIVILQDNVIDLCKDLAVLLTIRDLRLPDEIKGLVDKIIKISDEYFELYAHIKPLLAKAFVKSEVSEALGHVNKIVKIGEEFEKKYLEICGEVFEGLKPAELVLLRELIIYLSRIVENIVNAAKMFKIMIER